MQMLVNGVIEFVSDSHNKKEKPEIWNGEK